MTCFARKRRYPNRTLPQGSDLFVPWVLMRMMLTTNITPIVLQSWLFKTRGGRGLTSYPPPLPGAPEGSLAHHRRLHRNTKTSFTSVDGYIGSFKREEVAISLIMVDTRVNGALLPRAQGYPARVVAEDVFDSRWVKYLERDLRAIAEPGGPGTSFSLVSPPFLGVFHHLQLRQHRRDVVCRQFAGEVLAHVRGRLSVHRELRLCEWRQLYDCGVWDI